MASSNERTLTLLLALSGALASSGCVVTINDGDTDGDTEGDSTTESGSESTSGTSETGDGDGDGGTTSETGDGDGDGGTTAGDGDGDGDNPCAAWAESYVACGDGDQTVEEAQLECESYIEYGYLYSDDCGSTLSDFYACLSALDCKQMDTFTECGDELAAYELACGEAGDGDGDGDATGG